MTFLSTFIGSFTRLDTYRDVLKKPLRFSLLYGLTIYASAFLVMGILLFFAVGSFAERLNDALPQDFSLSYTNGTAHVTGINLPHTVHLAQVGSITFTEKELQIHANGKESVTTPYSALIPQETTFTATKADIAREAPALFKTAAIAMTAALFFALMFARALWIVLYALFFSALLSLLGNRMKFSHIAQLGIHAAVVAEVINLLYVLIYRSTSFPMFDLAFLAIMLLVLRTRPKQNGQTA